MSKPKKKGEFNFLLPKAAGSKPKTFGLDFETYNHHNAEKALSLAEWNELEQNIFSEWTKNKIKIENSVLGAWGDTNTGKPWSWAEATTALPRVHRPEKPYPGLTDRRRVVLDLTFRGYGTSAEVVGKTGELLGIVDPRDLKFDPVPGAHLSREALGTAVAKLVAAGAKFDLIVCDVMLGSTTPSVGIFAPPAPRQAATGRRLILPGRVVAKPVVGSLPLEMAAWRATQALLSPSGEALIGMHVTAINALAKDKDPFLKSAWWVQIDNVHARVYLRKDYESSYGRVSQTAPRQVDRYARRNLHDPIGWTNSQVANFKQALLSK